MMGQIALVGMPNVGKTALFNKLTGSFQRVANFPGVTVEKKTGWISEQGEKIIEVIDLPGLYSLDATTLDEKVTKDFLLQKDKTQHSIHFVLVLDATNLDKSLYIAFQLKKLGYPLLIALNLMDEAEKRGLKLDLKLLSQELNAQIIPTSAATGLGTEELVLKIKELLRDPVELNLNLPKEIQKTFRSPDYINGIFNEVDQLLSKVTIRSLKPDTLSERIDQWVLHPVWGGVILIFILLLMFQTLFSWSAPLSDGIEFLFTYLGEQVSLHASDKIFKSFLVDGVLSGVGGVLVFLPQIMILFLFIQFL